MLIKVSMFFQHVIFQRNFNSNFVFSAIYIINPWSKDLKINEIFPIKQKLIITLRMRKKNYTAYGIAVYLILQLINKLKLYSRKEQRNFELTFRLIKFRSKISKLEFELQIVQFLSFKIFSYKITPLFKKIFYLLLFILFIY